ncbi:MAG TPA: XRE family transcriptional regulator [Pirellulales bacterium]|nr:XRE family transcriptional regulator [Pirellulales bacterium]
MAGNNFPVDVNPTVLRWARETAGYSVEEAGGRVADRPTLEAWESGKGRPTWAAVGELAKLYKRPVAALLLAEPPAEPPLPPDFRTLPDANKRLSPKTRFAIRTARWLAGTAAELERELDRTSTFAGSNAHLSNSPEQIAEQCRKLLGISLDEQTQWQKAGEAFRQWRAAVEGQNVLVFQASMPLEEVRGFSLLEAEKSVIVLNQSDAVNPRIFTLFHEYGHLLLAKPGICLPEEGNLEDAQKTETFCNRFAAALLIPRDDIADRLTAGVAPENAVAALAARYRVSRAVVLGRLRGLRAISEQVYGRAMARLAANGPAPRRPGGGGRRPDERVVGERGRAFVSLVVDALDRDLITANDASDYLGIKLKYLDKAAARVK